MRYAALVLLLLLPLPAAAGTVAAALTPQSSTVAIRSYGLGLLPLDGAFARFHGVLHYDSADRTQCSVALQVDVASLTMGTAGLTAMVLGPNFLDAARYPVLDYQGGCDGPGLAGTLAMHGVTRPFALTLHWRGDAVMAVGRLRRAEWGMTARPLLGGRTVRITVTMRLPRPETAAG